MISNHHIGAHLVVIIPALNEEMTIATVIKAIPRQFPGIGKTDVVVIDDGSTDGTKGRAIEAGAKVVSHRRNMGVGRSYATGLHEALLLGADVIVSIDADGQFNPADIPTLIEPILAGQAEVVTASRFKDPSKTPEMPPGRLYGNLILSRLLSYIMKTRIHDISCGFRACTRDAAMNLNLNGAYTYTQEMLLDFAFKGISVTEVPIAVRGTREHGEAKMSSNLLRYAFRSARIITRAFRDYQPWRFFFTLACACFSVAVFELVWMFYWRLTTGDFTPYKWTGFAASFSIVVGMILTITGVVADMLRMLRLNSERSLYFDKRRYYESLRAGGQIDEKQAD
jgi:glycosyltransferase involved in cell wall biosynthesis